MKHLFVPYELSKVLKEEGFSEPCLGWWLSTKELHVGVESSAVMLSAFGGITYFPAPLYQQVVDWLREKHGLHIEVNFQDEILLFNYKITDVKLNNEQGGNWKLNYYEALTKAIEEAIKLIP